MAAMRDRKGQFLKGFDGMKPVRPNRKKAIASFEKKRPEKTLNVPVNNRSSGFGNPNIPTSAPENARVNVNVGAVKRNSGSLDGRSPSVMPGNAMITKTQGAVTRGDRNTGVAQVKLSKGQVDRLKERDASILRGRDKSLKRRAAISAAKKGEQRNPAESVQAANNAKVMNAAEMSPQQKIEAYQLMHGKAPSAAATAKLKAADAKGVRSPEARAARNEVTAARLAAGPEKSYSQVKAEREKAASALKPAGADQQKVVSASTFSSPGKLTAEQAAQAKALGIDPKFLKAPAADTRSFDEARAAGLKKSADATNAAKTANSLRDQQKLSDARRAEIGGLKAAGAPQQTVLAPDVAARKAAAEAGMKPKTDQERALENLRVAKRGGDQSEIAKKYGEAQKVGVDTKALDLAAAEQRMKDAFAELERVKAARIARGGKTTSAEEKRLRSVAESARAERQKLALAKANAEPFTGSFGGDSGFGPAKAKVINPNGPRAKAANLGDMLSDLGERKGVSGVSGLLPSGPAQQKVVKPSAANNVKIRNLEAQIKEARAEEAKLKDLNMDAEAKARRQYGSDKEAKAESKRYSQQAANKVKNLREDLAYEKKYGKPDAVSSLKPSGADQNRVVPPAPTGPNSNLSTDQKKQLAELNNARKYLQDDKQYAQSMRGSSDQEEAEMADLQVHEAEKFVRHLEASLKAQGVDIKLADGPLSAGGAPTKAVVSPPKPPENTYKASLQRQAKEVADLMNTYPKGSASYLRHYNIYSALTEKARKIRD